MTASPETIQRRASKSTATVAKSFHDSAMKANAKMRHDLGLRPKIVRRGSNCCPWCAEVAGKYRFGEQPDDIFRRHDNCDCTIIYDGKALRGKSDGKGGRTRTWEELPDVPDYQPTVLSQEEAAAMERNALSGLTLAGKRDILEAGSQSKNIRLDDIKAAVTGSPISEEVAEHIFDVLAEQGNQFKFDRVVVVNLDSAIVMQTDPVQNGTFYDVVLNLNEAFLGGKTVEQIDAEIATSDVSVIQSLREAVIHEIYHAKVYYGRNKGESDAIDEVLDGLSITGISPTAKKNGHECIAESGVLYERGEIKSIPEKAKELLSKYAGVTI